MDGNAPENLGTTRGRNGTTFIEVYLVGISPLLMNRMSQEALMTLVTGEKPSKNAPKLDPDQQCQEKIYRDADGRISIPMRNLFSAFAEAGRSVRLDGKKQVSTADSSKLAAIMTLSGEYTRVIDPADNTQEASWVMSLMKGTNPNGGQAVGICRPQFDRWALRFVIEANLREYQERTVREIVDRAGNEIGLGDFRPQKKGPYGRFRVDNWTLHRSQIDTKDGESAKAEGTPKRTRPSREKGAKTDQPSSEG